MSSHVCTDEEHHLLSGRSTVGEGCQSAAECLSRAAPAFRSLSFAEHLLRLVLVKGSP